MKLAAIGECMLELAPNGPPHYALGYGGDTLNTAIYFARFGGQVDFVTALGDDPLSQQMVDAWQQENVGTQLVMKKYGALPGLYMIQTDEQGERSFYYWRQNAPARTLIEDWPNIFSQLMTFPYLYLSGVTLSLFSSLSRNALFTFLDRYRAQQGRVIFDINYRPASWPNKADALNVFNEMLKRTDIALPSFDDEKLLHGEHSINGCIMRYRNAGASEIVVKDGVNGCWLYSNQKTLHCPVATKIQPTDTTAAGDSFNGAFLAARLAGQNAEQAVKQGQACAAVVIQHRGAIVANAIFKQANLTAPHAL